MSQLTVQLSDRADALIAQLQKEIFQRRRKKVSAAGVVESLLESGARSQSDKRFATAWRNLVADIEKSARLADAHGAKPASLSDEEWGMVLSHRSRAGAKPRTVRKRAASPATARKAGAPPQKAAASPVVGPAAAAAAAAGAKARPALRRRKRSEVAAAAVPTPAGTERN